MTAGLLIALFVLMFLRVPIGFALAGSCAFVFAFLHSNPLMFNYLGQAMVTTADSFPLMAIPFFMLVGSLMSRSGQAAEIINVAEAMTGTMAGGLGAAGIVACTIFAAISGSGPAVVAALGGFLIPAMTARGYAPAYGGALMAAGATIGPVIPPSIPMIVYGVSAGTSVVAMFIGGIIPGLLMAGALIAANWIISRRRGYKGVQDENAPSLWRVTLEAKWSLLLPVIILGGIYSGMFTPTEAAVVGSVYALFVGTVIYRRLNMKLIKEAMVEAGLMSSVVMFIMGGATTFGRLLTIERVPTMVAEALLAVTSSPVLIMLIILGLLLIGGMFLDTISNIVLFTPLFLPIVKQLGYDPVFFGVLMTINLCIGFITPPVGVNLFVAQSVCKASFNSLIKEAFPFIAVLLLVMILVLIFPGIVLFLPKVFGAIM